MEDGKIAASQMDISFDRAMNSENDDDRHPCNQRRIDFIRHISSDSSWAEYVSGKRTIRQFIPFAMGQAHVWAR